MITTQKQNKLIRASYTDFILQGFKLSFKEYKKVYLKMDKEIKELNKKELENLKEHKKVLDNCLNQLGLK